MPSNERDEVLPFGVRHACRSTLLELTGLDYGDQSCIVGLSLRHWRLSYIIGVRHWRGDVKEGVWGAACM